MLFFCSPYIGYRVDTGGQFCPDYYGMKHELIEHIHSVELFVDVDDEHVFKKFPLAELRTESKTVLHAPDYLLQVPSRAQLINLLDLAVHVRNVSFFILVLFYLRRASVALQFEERNRETKQTNITGPWRAAIAYVLGADRAPNEHYDAVFRAQFFELTQTHARARISARAQLYMDCMKNESFGPGSCRELSKAYLQCRMDT